ncbi:MAG: cupin domain-containing protein [Treponema sp.]|jgi:mannose-6-phosphate isomerase-like protein (cupin superfamily)|nr:cupin domain-containing protein [Treponema sp.]
MVYQRAALKAESKEKLRGGEGTAYFSHFVEGGSHAHVKLAAEIKLLPGDSIGYHQHVDETEYFVFIEGNGTVNDDGKERPIAKGDVMITGNGASHGVHNTGSVPLVINAFIITNN